MSLDERREQQLIALIGRVAELESKVSSLKSAETTTLLDEDDMASDSADDGATQQSIKAYVDASGGAQIATGTYTGDGTASNSITGVGFQPKYVRIWKSVASGSQPVIAETTDTIVDDDANGIANMILTTGDLYMYNNRIISLDADGFTVDDNGADSDPNSDAQVYNYMCIG